MLRVSQIFCVLSLHACAQAPLPYEMSRVVSEPDVEIEASGYRGLALANDIVVYIDDDLRTLSAYKEGTRIWQVDVPGTAGPSFVLDPAFELGVSIRHMMCNGKVLYVTYSKHCWATVQISDGAVHFEGCD